MLRSASVWKFLQEGMGQNPGSSKCSNRFPFWEGGKIPLRLPLGFVMVLIEEMIEWLKEVLDFALTPHPRSTLSLWPWAYGLCQLLKTKEPCPGLKTQTWYYAKLLHWKWTVAQVESNHMDWNMFIHSTDCMRWKGLALSNSAHLSSGNDLIQT